jgi:hypothetical protein
MKYCLVVNSMNTSGHYSGEIMEHKCGAWDTWIFPFRPWCQPCIRGPPDAIVSLDVRLLRRIADPSRRLHPLFSRDKAAVPMVHIEEGNARWQHTRRCAGRFSAQNNHTSHRRTYERATWSVKRGVGVCYSMLSTRCYLCYPGPTCPGTENYWSRLKPEKPSEKLYLQEPVITGNREFPTTIYSLSTRVMYQVL